MVAYFLIGSTLSYLKLHLGSLGIGRDFAFSVGIFQLPERLKRFQRTNLILISQPA